MILIERAINWSRSGIWITIKNRSILEGGVEVADMSKSYVSMLGMRIQSTISF